VRCYVEDVRAEPSKNASGGPLLRPARTRGILLAAASAVVFILLCLILRPFVAVITWAAALAIVGRPLHAWLERKLNPSLAALVAVLLIAVLIVAPAVLIVRSLFVEITNAIQPGNQIFNVENVRARLESVPPLAQAVNWLEQQLDLDRELRNAASALAGRVSGWVSGSLWAAMQLVLTFLTLFYFFRDQRAIVQLIYRIVPLSSTDAADLIQRVGETVSASLRGTVFVKVAQGLLGALIFWVLGLPLPVLSGAVMTLFAFLPMFGTALVWLPAAIILALTGSWVKAIILAAFGALVISVIDNVLYPLLVAGQLRFHTLAVFFAVFGGLIAFGLTGIVLGPVILALTVALLDIWGTQTSGAGEVSGAAVSDPPGE
jgi:predicted PurR-regulated permease PerM